MKLLNGIGVVASVTTFFVNWYYYSEVFDLRLFFAYSDFFSYPEMERAITYLTREGIYVLAVFSVFFLILQLKNIQTAKTKKRKSIAYFFMTLVLAEMVYLGIIYSRPMHISFDEAAPVLVVFSAFMLVASILFLKQDSSSRKLDEDIIDDIT